MNPSHMPLQAWLTLILLVSVFVVMALDRMPTWVIFPGALTVAMTLRLAPAPALLKGFSNAGVLTVAALFPVAAAMYSTGAISLLSRRLLGNPKSETAAGLRILPSMAIGSAFLNNTPMVAMMIPVVPLPGSPYRALLVGVSRGGDAPAGDLDELRVEPGDAAVLEVDPRGSRRS